METVKMLGAYKRIQATKGKIFSATFIKKDGSVREMNCRLGVKKGVTGVGMNYEPTDYNLIPVYDMQKKEFRMLNMNTIKQLKVNKKVYNVE